MQERVTLPTQIIEIQYAFCILFVSVSCAHKITFITVENCVVFVFGSNSSSDESSEKRASKKRAEVESGDEDMQEPPKKKPRLKKKYVSVL